ncbi:MAG: hypothetical protein HC893_15470 [Chloroflexaceae bacterium]|nr:hypothetical protein [Chloroflexaceae bacterium]
MNIPTQPALPYKPRIAATVATVLALLIWLGADRVRWLASRDNLLNLQAAPDDAVLTTLAALCGFGMASAGTPGELLAGALVAVMVPAVVQLALVLVAMLLVSVVQVAPDRTRPAALLFGGGFLVGFLATMLFVPSGDVALAAQRVWVPLAVGIYGLFGAPSEESPTVWFVALVGVAFALYVLGSLTAATMVVNATIGDVSLNSNWIVTALTLDFVLAAGVLLVGVPEPKKSSI